MGRNATDPRILLSLWLYAANDTVGGTQGIARAAIPCPLELVEKIASKEKGRTRISKKIHSLST
jgi:hypothetical protein